MVDLVGQYQGIKKQVDESITQILNSATFINGPEVHSFQKELEDYETGIDLLLVKMKDVVPPDLVAESFNEVEKANIYIFK